MSKTKVFKLDVQLTLRKLVGIGFIENGATLFLKWKSSDKYTGETKRIKRAASEAIWDETISFPVTITQEKDQALYNKKNIDVSLLEEVPDGKKVKVKKIGKLKVNLGAFIKADAGFVGSLPLTLEKRYAKENPPMLEITINFKFLRLNQWNLLPEDRSNPFPPGAKSVQIDGQTFQLQTADDASEGSEEGEPLEPDNDDDLQPRPANDLLIKTDALLRDKDAMLDRQQSEIKALQQKLDQLERVVAGGAPQALVVEHLMRENAQLKHALSQHKAALGDGSRAVPDDGRQDQRQAQAERISELQLQNQELLETNTRYREALSQQQQSLGANASSTSFSKLYMIGTLVMLTFAVVILLFKGDGD